MAEKVKKEKVKKEKKEKVKKPKPAKKVKAGKAKKSKGEKQPISKKKKLLIVVMAVVFLASTGVLAALFLKDRFAGGEQQEVVEVVPPPEPVETPVLYEVSDEEAAFADSVLALPVGAAVLVYEEDCEPFALPEQKTEAETTELSATVSTDGETTDGETTDGEDTTEEDAEGSGETEEEVEEPVYVTTYRYEGLTDGSRIPAYCRMLTAEDFGFTPVDENMIVTELPEELDALSRGSVHLVRKIVTTEESEQAVLDENGEPVLDENGEELMETVVTETDTGYLLSLRIQWGRDWCSVTPEAWEGYMRQPPSEQAATQPTPMTMAEALEFVKGLEPGKIGLTGESMDDYNIYVLDGTAIVGGTPCMRFGIYGGTDHNTNAIAGQYFLTGDGSHMYLLTEEGTVRQMF